MPHLSPRAAVCALLLVAGAAPAASAQASTRLSTAEPRVLFDASDVVKTDDGGRALRRTTLVFDPVAGEYVRTVRDAEGRVLRRTVSATSEAGPTAAEDAAAQALVRGEPGVAAEMARARRPVTVSGGFPLVREAGHPCGPGSRCLQYDVFETGEGAPPRRLRFVVVDLRTLTIVDADLDPAAEGNLTNPEARRQSRHRDF